MYKAYSPEWHRKRYLEESIQKYFDAGESPDVVVEDLRDILLQWLTETEERSESIKEILDTLS